MHQNYVAFLHGLEHGPLGHLMRHTGVWTYAVVNLMGRYDFSKQLTATLNVNNLFNRKYLSALDQTFYTGYYGAPRNAMLNLRYSF